MVLTVEPGIYINDLLVDKNGVLWIASGEGVVWYDSDKDHKHPKGEINCLLPITSMRGSNSVWRESSPFKGDFKPFELEEGEMIYWNGNECHHGNKVNKTCHTRVSFDFRVMPNEFYLKNIVNVKEDKRKISATRGTKFMIGSYYKEII